MNCPATDILSYHKIIKQKNVFVLKSSAQKRLIKKIMIAFCKNLTFIQLSRNSTWIWKNVDLAVETSGFSMMTFRNMLNTLGTFFMLQTWLALWHHLYWRYEKKILTTPNRINVPTRKKQSSISK
jgi:cbb3-type cytochrome oxidase subunit 3